MRILITGANGRLGSALTRVLFEQSHDVTAIDIEQLDITSFDAARAVIGLANPDLVVHTAAWTDVDGCARDPQRAVQINGYGTQNVALAAAAVGAGILYVSSNEVFDGRATRPYLEYDPTNPVNPYGYSKWVGEQTVIQANRQHYIVRTSWLFAHGGKNFVQSILNAAQAGKPLRVVTDEVANPTYTDDLAEAIAALLTTGRFGTYHLVNEGVCSRYDFARYALNRVGMTDTPVERITSQDWQRPSTPPPYSALSNVAGQMVGVTLRPWQAAVDAFLDKEGLRVKD